MIYNRIPVTFDGQRSITGPLVSYQYDVKQFLVIQGLELPAYYEVDFCNEGDEQTITMVGDEDGVQIPDDFFLTGKRIKAYVIVQGEDDGAVETRYEVTLPVRQRPERTDIDPTPAEQTQIDMMVELMGKAAAGNDSLSKLDAGNLLPEFAEFPTTDDIFSRHVTLVWSDDKTQAQITGSAPGYDLYIPLYDLEITPEPFTPNFPPELEYDVEYLFRYKTTDSNVRLFMEINSEDYEYDHDFLFTVPDGGSLYIALHIPKNTEVDATVTLSMPFQKSGLELEKEFRESSVIDVKLNGESVVNNGTANIPIASTRDLGLVKGAYSSGVIISSTGSIDINPAASWEIKAGTSMQKALTSHKQHEAVFYGLAKAAGDTTQTNSANAVGTYTDEAKTAIKNMLGTADGISEKADNILGFVPEDFTLDYSTKDYYVTLETPLPMDVQYTLSLMLKDCVPDASNNNFLARYIDENGNYTNITPTGSIRNGRQFWTFTPSVDVYQFRFVISQSIGSATTVTVTEMQVQLGDKFTFYAPSEITAVDYKLRSETASSIKVSDYSSLYAALINVDYDTIVLDDDITISAPLTAARDLIIFGNGHTISGTASIESVLTVSGSARVEIFNTQLHTCGSGKVLAFEGSSTLICHNCDIGFSYENDGVSGHGNASGYFYNCNSHDNYDEGISTHNASYCEVHGGEFYNNGYAVGTRTKGAASSFGGIHLGGGRMGIVEGAHAHDNCTYGIGLINFQDLTPTDVERCYGNLVENNGDAGIWCTACRDLILTNNSVIHNGGDAIHFGLDDTYTPTVDLVASSGYVAGNVMYANGSDSVYVDPNVSMPDLHVQQ